eukprot:2931629-Rhodomonas_salina.1
MPDSACRVSPSPPSSPSPSCPILPFSSSSLLFSPCLLLSPHHMSLLSRQLLDAVLAASGMQADPVLRGGGSAHRAGRGSGSEHREEAAEQGIGAMDHT